MNTIRGWTGAVLGALLGGSVALGDSTPTTTKSSAPASPVVTITTEPLPPATGSPVVPAVNRMPSMGSTSLPWGPPPTTVEPPVAPPVAGPSPSLSSPGPVEAWLNHHQPGCCGPVGGDGPISYDMYLRTGSSIPYGGGTLSQVLEVGWLVRGGLRTLFFNPSGSSAFYIDGNLEVVRNNGTADKTIAFFGRPVVVRGVTRTNFGIAVGKEWYTQGPGFVHGNCNYSNISWGFDFGGRWGTSHVDLLRTPAPAPGLLTARQYDVIGGLNGGFNVNWEQPMGGWTLLLGGRLEGTTTFTDVLPGYGGTLYDVNILLSAGIRY